MATTENKTDVIYDIYKDESWNVIEDENSTTTTFKRNIDTFWEGSPVKKEVVEEYFNYEQNYVKGSLNDINEFFSGLDKTDSYWDENEDFNMELELPREIVKAHMGVSNAHKQDGELEDIFQASLMFENREENQFSKELKELAEALAEIF